MNLKQVSFSNYIHEEHPKNQVYLHHTAGGPSGEAVFRYWEKTPERVATCVSISNDGTIVQGYSSKYWGYHLGLQKSTFAKHNLPYKSLDRTSIGVEICNYGFLTEKNGKFVNYVGGICEDICELETPYKRHKYWQNYTDAQIESTRDLLLLWRERYGIDLTYNEDIWDVTPRALAGENGVFTHNSVRYDKADIYPHPKMIEMLKSLA
jgi:N-acetyl-anhydromuramyl-L-alanine amidase AmpD